MASRDEVKKYLAHWFQLGKAVISEKNDKTYLPENIIQGNRYSPAFEQCWDLMVANQKAFYLRGTDQTVADLLSPAWEIASCARCNMPIPMPQVERKPHPCPCEDLSNWPNNELPGPRSPIDSQAHLGKLRSRLQQSSTSAE